MGYFFIPLFNYVGNLMLRYNSKINRGTSNSSINLNNNEIFYFIKSDKVSNRFLQYNFIPSNIIGYKNYKDIYIKDIEFQSKANSSDTTIILIGDEVILTSLNVLSGIANISFNDVNIKLLSNSKLKIFIKSNDGVDYPFLILRMN